MRRSARFAHCLALAELVAACERRETRVPAPAPQLCPEPQTPDRDAQRAAVDTLRGNYFEPLHAVELAAVVGSTCARDRDGAVWCWGDSFTNDPIRGAPEQIWLDGAAMTLDSDGHFRFCAVLDVGVVQCWMSTHDLTTIVRAPPTAALTVADSAVVLRRSDGTHVCWAFEDPRACRYDGANPRGDLVDGDVVCIRQGLSRSPDGRCAVGRAVRLGPTPLRCEEPDMSPACHAVRDGWPMKIPFGELTLTGPGSYGCALDSDGAVECATAQPLGSSYLDRGRVSIALEPASQLVMPHWGGHACALDRSGRVWCWGDNSEGAVGVAPLADTERPVAVAGLRDIVDIDADGDTFCALDESGSLWCWGALGYGLDRCSPRMRPTLIGRFDRPTALSVVFRGACVQETGGVRCVGIDLDVGRSIAKAGSIRGVSSTWHTCTLHDTRVICRELPGTDTQCRPGRVVTSAEVGPALAIVEPCVLMPDGDVRCWNHRGVVASEGNPEPIVQLRGDWGVWCGREADGDIYCSPTRDAPARRITGLSAVDLDLDDGHACLVTARGGVRCWNDDGPVEATYVKDARRVAVGPRSACALLVDRSVVCWGDGDAILGRGYTAQISGPLPVVKRR